MHQANILVVEPNQEVPEKLLELICKEFDSCIGVAQPVPENKELGLVVATTGPDVENLKTVLYGDGRKAYRKFIYQAKTNGTVQEEDIQPFIIAEDSGGKPAVLLFMEGDFVAKKKPAQSSHSEEFHLFYDVIRPMCKKIWDQCEHDADKFMKELESDELFTAFLRQTWMSRGAVVILANNGLAIPYRENELGIDDDWGWSSHHCGYLKSSKDVVTGAVKSAAASVSNALASALGGGKKPPVPTAPPKPAAAAPSAPKVPIPGVKPGAGATTVVPKAPTAEAPKTETSVQAMKPQAKEGYKWVAPPANFSRSQKKDWYKRVNVGSLPNGWKEGVPIEILESKSVKDFRELSQADIDKFVGKKVQPQVAKDKQPELAIIPSQDRKDFLDFLNSKEAKATIEFYAKNPPRTDTAPGHEQLGKDGLEFITPWAGIYEFVRDMNIHAPCSMAAMFVELWGDYKMMLEAEGEEERPAEEQPETPALEPDAGTEIEEEKKTGTGGARIPIPVPGQRRMM